MEYVFRLRATYPLSPNEVETEWSEFSPAEAALLDRTRKKRLRPRGHTIFQQNDDPSGVYWIEAGLALLSRIDVSGNETAFGIVGPGETLGHRSYFAGEAHAATARALIDCRVYLIPETTMRQLLDSNPALARWFLRTIARDRGPRDGLLLRGSGLTARVRLVHLLLVLKDRFAQAYQDGRLVFDLPLKRQEIASMLGVSPETVARTIRQLKDEGIATFNGHRIVVPHLDRLLNAAEPNI